MTSYLRPAIEARVFRDADGQVIDYGRRWTGSPPEETYSVVSHPERYAPLHTVADALIAHLRGMYDVDIDDADEVVAGDLLHQRAEVQRAVRLRPVDAMCAPLTFVFTTFPGVIVHAGLLHDFAFPICGCDACDSSWQHEADELERAVLSVVSGGYEETLSAGPGLEVGFRLIFPNGSASGQRGAEDVPADRTEAAATILRGLPGAWRAWPPRTKPGSASVV